MKTLSLLIKPVSGSCSMRCGYCFYADVTDNRTEANYGVMSGETCTALAKSCLREAEELCVFGFQGGEPTLAGLEYFRKFVGIVKANNRRGIHVRYALQTNGLHLDDEWAAFLVANNFLVGLSIDAGKRVHDMMRRDKAGKGSYARSLAALRLLEKHKVAYNILGVVTREVAAHPGQSYRHYRNLGVGHLQLIPCIEHFDHDGTALRHAPSPEQYGRFLCTLFDLWHHDYVSGKYISIRMFDNYIHMLGGYPPENCAASGQCRASLLVEADGSVFPCDFYALDQYRLGNIVTDSPVAMLTGDVACAFERPTLEAHAVCRSCEYFSLCRGGCRRDREPMVGGVPGLNAHCEAYRIFFHHALPRMKELAKTLFFCHT